MRKKISEKKDNIFIIVPGLNEEKRVGRVIRKLIKLGYNNVIFVDDGSTDKSEIVARRAGATVLKHLINIGKGAAANTGCTYAVKQGAKTLILIDADGQHKPEDVPKIVTKLKETKSDIVFGYRAIDKNMPFVMKFGNSFINKATHIINGIKIRDSQSGFRCFTAQAYKKIKWKATDYSMESEMIANVARHKLKFAELNIQTIYLDNFKGTTIFDGIKIFINILKFRIFGGAL